MGKIGRRFSYLAVSQVLSLLCIPALIFVLVTVYWHQTDNVFAPYGDYVSSFEIAFPPAILFAASYIVVFLTGVPLSEAPRFVIAFFRNRFLQSPRMMAMGIAITITLFGWTLWFVQEIPPPSYVRLVAAIMRGEADNFAEARATTNEVVKVNPELGTQLSLAIEVFAERAGVNLKAAQNQAARARLLVASLSSDAPTPWLARSLRQHALAEAYSLLASAFRQIESNASIVIEFGSWSSEKLFDEGLKRYQVVAASTDPLATPLMRASALNNIGNLYYYRGQFPQALEAYRAANSADFGFTNTGTWGNIVAILTVTGQYDQAVVEGEAGRSWAEATGNALKEASQYAGILVNTALARVARGDYAGAQNDLLLADGLQSDQNTTLNLALAHVLAGNLTAAKAALRTVVPPTDRNAIGDPAVLGTIPRCAQLMWFLAEPEAQPPDQAAKLHVFRGELFLASELANVTHDDVAKLRHEVAVWLPNFPGNCNSLSLIKPVVRAIAGD
jgi:tetratricopeptide (TPR) repeat protein